MSSANLNKTPSLSDGDIRDHTMSS